MNDRTNPLPTADEDRALRELAQQRERAARREATLAREERDAAMRRATAPPVAVFVPPRRRWPGVLAAGAVGAVMAAVAVSSFYDHRTLGQKLDATVDAAHSTLQQGANQAATQGAEAGAKVAGELSDAGITAAVKAALATDPALSALSINVSTQSGVVTLEGPAPDAKARDRASVLAAAPDGVQRVDNRLVVAGNAGTTPDTRANG